MKRSICLIVAVALVGCAAPRKWSKDEKIALTHCLAARSTNYYMTLRHQDYDEIHEINPVMGRHPDDVKITVYYGLTTGLIVLIAHLCPKIRKPLLINMGNLGIYFSLRDYDLIKEARR